MTNVQQTSAAAYASLEDLGERQAAVRNAISTMGAACNTKIAEYLDVHVNQLTGRVFELRARAWSGMRTGPSGRTVIWWETV
ncbi:hypothetical protein [Paenarthrobacter sp. YJN-5]|uniref:hypothetical protein n=1 Tax=Paenarthrobacter sp. YJN-5 TaxID=2735316 RepID=UPI001878CBBE|nr:hypothetical protein [Paenarthrobacter sp. YJN-5]QOT19242.1 hypothetical protein HMI59_21260 [Paenarthrobacter sp. YJN-5]